MALHVMWSAVADLRTAAAGRRASVGCGQTARDTRRPSKARLGNRLEVSSRNNEFGLADSTAIRTVCEHVPFARRRRHTQCGGHGLG